MPIWTYFYLLVVVIGGVFALIVNKKKSYYYIPGELLSVFSCIALFLVAYDVVQLTRPIVTSTVCLVFLLYWEIWENRHHYTFYKTSSSEFAETVELGEGETLEDAALSIKIIKYVSVAFLLLFALPVFHVYLKVLFSGT